MRIFAKDGMEDIALILGELLCTGNRGRSSPGTLAPYPLVRYGPEGVS